MIERLAAWRGAREHRTEQALPAAAERAALYRRYAAEMRDLAALKPAGTIRDQLVTLARQYEVLARRVLARSIDGLVPDCRRGCDSAVDARMAAD